MLWPWGFVLCDYVHPYIVQCSVILSPLSWRQKGLFLEIDRNLSQQTTKREMCVHRFHRTSPTYSMRSSMWLDEIKISVCNKFCPVLVYQCLYLFCGTHNICAPSHIETGDLNIQVWNATNWFLVPSNNHILSDHLVLWSNTHVPSSNMFKPRHPDDHVDRESAIICKANEDDDVEMTMDWGGRTDTRFPRHR